MDVVLTHIIPERRIEKIQEWLPKAEMARENSDCEHVCLSSNISFSLVRYL